jgi:hypothetical protein
VSGHRAIRVCIVNQRTRDEDLTFMLDSLKRIAAGMPAQRCE